FVGSSKNPTEVGQTKVINVLVKDIKPGTVLNYPIQTGYLYVYLSGSAVGRSDGMQKFQRLWYVFQNMAQHDGVSFDTYARIEVLFVDIGRIAFIRWINAYCIMSSLSDEVQKATFAATHLKNALVRKVQVNLPQYFIHMLLEER